MYEWKVNRSKEKLEWDERKWKSEIERTVKAVGLSKWKAEMERKKSLVDFGRERGPNVCKVI